MSNPIPGAVRSTVRGRDALRCQRCGMRGAELHHRRGKSVKDGHTHCPCNLIYLCGRGNHTGCHGWVHSTPFEARPLGFMVLRSVPDPSVVPFYSTPLGGWAYLNCEGQVFTEERPEETP